MAAQTQKDVTFYGDKLIAIRQDDSGAIFVPLTRLCDSLGIVRARQAQIIRDHPVLNRGFETLTIETPGGTQDAQCLRLDMIPLWLAGVNTKRVKAEIREKVIRYQTEAATILWEAFKPEILGADTLTPPAGQSGAQIAYEMATAIQHLARQQLDFEQRLDRSARWAKTIEDRVASIEVQIGTDGQVSEAQASEIAGAVKTVAHALEQRGISNAYQRVYGELYRRFGVSTYKSLPHRRLQEVLDWLKAWHDETTRSPAAE